MTTPQVAAVASSARDILASWDLPTGWESMTVTRLQDECDANVAFDDAYTYTFGDRVGIDDHFLDTVNAAMDAYNERYAR